MQHNLLTPAVQAVLDALRELGQGNVHDLADKSGKARSTTDKAIKTLAEAGVIVPVGTDTDADAAEATPTRWTLADDIPAEADNDLITDADLGDNDTAGGSEDYATEFDTGEPESSPADDRDNGDDSQPGDGPVGEANQDTDDEGDADVQADDEEAQGDDSDDDHGADDGDEDDDAYGEDGAEEDDRQGDRATVAVVQPSRPGDRKIMTIKAVLSERGGDGATLDEIVAESGIGHPTASRLLAAMEQAGAARRLPGTPSRWIAGPTKASEVDPNPQPPRCPLCLQAIRGLSESPHVVAQVLPLIRPDGTLHVVAEDATVHTVALPTRMPARTAGIATAAVRRPDVTINADGNQPFAKGELEKLTFDLLKANPGRTMTPQEIATQLGSQLNRTISPGAVRNNCGKLGAAGHILMVSDSPWTFVYPQVDGSDADQTYDATADQS